MNGTCHHFPYDQKSFVSQLGSPLKTSVVSVLTVASVPWRVYHNGSLVSFFWGGDDVVFCFVWFWSVSFNFVRRTSWACGRTCQTLTSSCWIRDESLPVSTLSIGKRLGRGSFPSWRLPQHIDLKWEHAIVSAGPTFQTRSCVWHLKHLGHPRSSNWWLVVPEKLK